MLPLAVSWTCDGELVLSSSEGRVLAAVRSGNRPFGKGTVGGGGKKVLEAMMGSRAHTESQCEESRENRSIAVAGNSDEERTRRRAKDIRHKESSPRPRIF